MAAIGSYTTHTRTTKQITNFEFTYLYKEERAKLCLRNRATWSSAQQSTGSRATVKENEQLRPDGRLASQIG